MNEVKDALFKMVKVGRKLNTMMDNYVKNGVNETPLFDVWGDVLDGIYALLGEHTETIEESVTYTAMTAPYLCIERRTEMLYAEYEKKHPAQPKPHTMESGELKHLHNKNGGYMTPEGDWT